MGYGSSCFLGCLVYLWYGRTTENEWYVQLGSLNSRINCTMNSPLGSGHSHYSPTLSSLPCSPRAHAAQWCSTNHLKRRILWRFEGALVMKAARHLSSPVSAPPLSSVGTLRYKAARPSPGLLPVPESAITASSSSSASHLHRHSQPAAAGFLSAPRSQHPQSSGSQGRPPPRRRRQQRRQRRSPPAPVPVPANPPYAVPGSPASAPSASPRPPWWSCSAGTRR